jgi:argininosuccinate lyase
LSTRVQQMLVQQAEKHLGSEFSVQSSELKTEHSSDTHSTLNAQRSTVLPGYTHRQHAQPVLLSHHLLAYFWKFQRDRERFTDCRKRTSVSPLGAAALAGTSFPIDPKMVAQELGFKSTFENSMDAVSDRDFVAEFLAAAAICATHFSSLAGELVLWSSPEIGFVQISDEWCTGSSIMPQKRNPDMAELIHGKSARILGHLSAILVLLKGLPLTYNRDLQEDKETLFDADDSLRSCLAVMAGMLETAEFQADRMLQAVEQSPFVAATEIADYLARKGMPFRQAHSVSAKIVRQCEEQNKGLTDLSLDDLKTFTSLFEADILPLLAARNVAQAKTSPGGTAPERVREQLKKQGK